jgi:hypothetical protein
MSTFMAVFYTNALSFFYMFSVTGVGDMDIMVLPLPTDLKALRDELEKAENANQGLFNASRAGHGVASHSGEQLDDSENDNRTYRNLE